MADSKKPRESALKAPRKSAAKSPPSAAAKAPAKAAAKAPAKAAAAKALAETAAKEPRKTPRPTKSKQPTLEGNKLALAIAEAGLDKKALEVVVIDVDGKVDYADFVVVMSGRSDRQVSAICKGIEQDVREKHGVKCLAVEGLPQAQWALMDFGDVIVHVFHEDVRGYYDLETLWMDAARVAVESGPKKKAPSKDAG